MCSGLIVVSGGWKSCDGDEVMVLTVSPMKRLSSPVASNSSFWKFSLNWAILKV